MPPAAQRRNRLPETLKTLASAMALPLGAAYSLAMRARRAAYERGLIASLRPGAPCVCVGNISMGGSGKTPITAWLLAWAMERGLTPVALSRGYGGSPPDPPLLVTEQNPWRETGDEPLLLARSAPGAHIVVDPKRIRSCPWAQHQFSPDLILMDDGMQHLALRRDLDLALLTPRDLDRGWNRVFPSGRWREGASALSRAAAFLVKAEPSQFEALAPLLSRRLGRFQAPAFGFHLAPTGLDHVAGPAIDHASDTGPTQAPHILATAVGDNQGVARAAESLMKRPPERTLFWRDHHAFNRADADAIQEAARAASATLVLCTPKDAIKLAELDWQTPLYAITPQVRFLPGPDGRSFPDWWETTWPQLKETPHGA